MSNFKTRFQLERQNPIPRRTMILRYNDYRMKCPGALIVVEGYSDMHFYSNTNIKVLNNQAKYIFHIKDDQDEYGSIESDIIGKEAVISAYFDIRNNSILNKELWRTVFIIDKDFENEAISQKYYLSDQDKQCFSMTPYHSFECFFLTPINIVKLFSYFGISLRCSKEFQQLFYQFSKEACEYFALQGTIVACYNHKWKIPQYIKTYKREEIFQFYFDDNHRFCYDHKKMKYEVECMRRALYGNPPAIEFYSQLKEALQSNALYLQGHTIFDFLQGYLSQLYGISFSYNKNDYDKYRQYCNFIQQMELKIGIVFGDRNALSSTE